MTASDLEDRLRAAMESAVRDELPPAGLLERATGSHRRRAGRRGLTVIVAVLVAGAALAGSLLVLGKPQTPVVNSTSPLDHRPERLLPGQRSGPLYDAQTALLAVGHQRQFARLFTTVFQDPARDRVLLYITDLAQADALVTAAEKHGPAFPRSVIRAYRVRYSIEQLANAAHRLLQASIRHKLPFPVYAASFPGFPPSPIGASLDVTVANVAAARRLAGRPVRALGGRSVNQFAGVRLTFDDTGQVVPL